MKEHPVALRIDKAVFRFMHAVSMASMVALLAVAVICSVDSLSTKIFSTSIPSGTDWVTYLNIPVVFLAMGFLQVERGNTVVDLLSNKFPPVVQKVIRTASNVLGTAICGYLGYCQFRLTADKFAKHAMSSSQMSAFPVWPFALIIAIGYSLVAVSFFWCIFREYLVPDDQRAGAFRRPEEMEEEA